MCVSAGDGHFCVFLQARVARVFLRPACAFAGCVFLRATCTSGGRAYFWEPPVFERVMSTSGATGAFAGRVYFYERRSSPRAEGAGL